MLTTDRSRLTAALADRYRIERELGQGGMATVYLGAAVTLLSEAIARHDVWVVQFPRSLRYDKLRKDPRAAAMLDKLGTLP